MRTTLAALASATLTLTAAPAGGQTLTIGTGAMGPGDNITMFATQAGQGQTFIAPVGATALVGFTAYIGAALQIATGSGADLLFELYPWGGSAPTGGALVTRAMSYTFGQTTLFTGSVAVTPGSAYLAVLHGGDWAPALGRTPGDVDLYTGGAWVVEGIGGGYAARFPNADARFTAVFAMTSVPEPATVALVGGGLLALVAAGRRRRTR